MSDLVVALTVVGGLIVVLGLFSSFIRRYTVVTEPVVALATGVALGPAVFGVLDVSAWGQQASILEHAARLTLAVSLMAIALRLPPGYFKTHWRALLLILGLIMPLMWLSSGLLVYLLLGLPFWIAMLVGAVVTPTDPIIATSIVTGVVAKDNLPERLRQTISAEAGANDGLAYPLLLLAVLLLTHAPGEALSEWLVHVWLREVGGAVLIGAFFGHLAGRALTWSEEKKIIEQHSFLAYTLALSLLTLGAAMLAGTEGILAVFIAGLAFDNVVGGKERAEEERVQEAIEQFFFIPMFVLLGSVIPWEAWFELGWSGLALAVAVLLLRRLPAVMLLAPFIKTLPHQRDRFFFGWFGPVGIAAILYAMIAVERTGRHEVWTIASLVISASVIAHGLTANPWARWFGRSRTTTE